MVGQYYILYVDFLSTSALIPTNPYLSAIITNIIHLFVELIEKDRIPYTNELIESNVNHMLYFSL
jgi:hypothetical protein